jgi:hypothetical protein
MVDGMADERIGKACSACGWLVTERDGQVALCMHDVTFLGPPPAIWVPLTEPMEARMLRFGHDGTVTDLGSVTVEPAEPPPIVLAPWPEATATCSALLQRHEEPPTPWEPVSHGNAWRPVRLTYFPEAPYPGEVVVGHDGKPYGVLLPSGAVAPLPSDPEVP